MAHGQWTEVEARGVLAAWKKSGRSPSRRRDAVRNLRGSSGFVAGVGVYSWSAHVAVVVNRAVVEVWIRLIG